MLVFIQSEENNISDLLSKQKLDGNQACLPKEGVPNLSHIAQVGETGAKTGIVMSTKIRLVSESPQLLEFFLSFCTIKILKRP